MGLVITAQIQGVGKVARKSTHPLTQLRFLDILKRFRKIVFFRAL